MWDRVFIIAEAGVNHNGDPELARRLALKGCQLILNPVSIPAARQDLWRALGLVRAAENPVFVAVANNTGSAYADGRIIAGGSFVAFPDGTLGAACGREEAVLRVRLEQARIAEIRQRWPYLGDVSKAGGGRSESSAQSSEAAAKEKGKRRR